MKKKVKGILYAGMVILTVLAGLKGIWISLDIDESYAVAQSYRLAKGDLMLLDMWEPHQFSAFLGALFIKPYLWITGTTDYLVIYLRIIGALIHTGLGLALYGQLRKNYDKAICFFILLIHLNFLPKWLQLPEFELMHYWFLLTVFLLLYRYFTFSGGKSQWLLLFGAGVCLVGSMLCYPTMILLYPFYFAGICVLEKQLHHKKGGRILTGGGVFTLGALMSGLGFLGYLFSYMSFDEFQRYLSYIFLDESHTTYTAAEKWTLYAGELAVQGQEYLTFLLVAIGIFAVLLLAGMAVCHMRKEKINRSFFTKKNIEAGIMALLLLVVIEMEIVQIYGCLLQDENQFFLQSRYIAMLLPAVYLGIRYHNRMAKWLYLCVLPGLLSVPAVMMVTNMNINTACSKAFVGVLGGILLLYDYRRLYVPAGGTASEAHSDRLLSPGEVLHKVILCLQYVAVFGLLAGFFVCRLILIRVTGCLPVTVRAPFERLEAGPGKGIYVLQETGQIWNDNYAELEKYIEGEDRLLYIGAENLTYVAAGCTAATPSTQGTAVFNEMYLYYYKEHPEKLPNVIVIDKTYESNPVYAYSPQNEVIFGWIEENYADAAVIETDYMTILRK